MIVLEQLYVVYPGVFRRSRGLTTTSRGVVAYLFRIELRSRPTLIVWPDSVTWALFVTSVG